MPDPLEVATSDLLERLVKERSRPADTPGTARVGGVAKVGSKLESLLRVALEEVAGVLSVEPESLLPSTGSRKPSLKHASEGTLATALRKVAPLAKGIGPGTQILVEDLWSRTSAVKAFITVRNDAAHRATLPKNAEQVLGDLRRLTLRIRVAAGWSTTEA